MAIGKKSNRRKHSRVSICRLVKINFSTAKRAPAVTNVYDISEMGMRFHVTDLSDSGFQLGVPPIETGQSAFKALSEIKKSDTLLFRLKLDPDSPDIAILGKIAWLTREATTRGNARLRAGIEFLDVSEDDRKLIQIYVSAFQD